MVEDFDEIQNQKAKTTYTLPSVFIFILLYDWGIEAFTN